LKHEKKVKELIRKYGFKTVDDIVTISYNISEMCEELHEECCKNCENPKCDECYVDYVFELVEVESYE